MIFFFDAVISIEALKKKNFNDITLDLIIYFRLTFKGSAKYVSKQANSTKRAAKK